MHPRVKSLRAWSVLLVLLVPIVLASAPVVGQYREFDSDSVLVESRSVAMIAPAVGERADGSLVGVGMEVQVTTRTGSGGVFLDTRPLTQLDMQGSARLAATMATSITGSDFQEHDFVIKVRSPTPAVGGPSAGGAMAVGFTALLLDVPVRQDVMMTGMINPDGSIGPVGGIIQKAEAAHLEGARLFLIPEGQGTVRHVERTVEGEGPTERVVEHESRVDVAEYAQERWGLRVEEVADVHDAFRFFTDHELERPVVPVATRSPVFDEVMGEAAEGQLGEADARFQQVHSDLEQSGLSASHPQLYGDLQSVLERAEDRLDRAHGAMDAGAPYTASSRAFQASVEISRAEVWLSIAQEQDPGQALADRIEEVSPGVEAAIAEAAETPLDSVVVLEAVGAAQVRAAEAGRLVTQSQQSLEEGRLTAAVEALAFARERERSVAWWLMMASELGARVEALPLEVDLGALAVDYRQVAREAMTYAEVLGSQIGGGETQSRLLGMASSSLRDSQVAQEDGLMAGALYLAVESQVASHAALSLLGSQALIADRLERQQNAAVLAIEDARRLGMEPFLAVSFQEFAQALRPEDPVAALLLYGNAAVIATISGALAGGERPIFGVGAGPSEPPLVSRVGGLGPDPWTGYFALATIVFGFMAGILVTLIVVQARTPLREGPAPSPIPAKKRSRRGAAYPMGAVHSGHLGHLGQAGNGDRAPVRRSASHPQPLLAVRRPPASSARPPPPRKVG
jgi:uncharacterized protein